MAEFTPIETQEDFDAAIKDRLAREQAKYKGYLSPEDVQERYKDYLSPEDVQERYKDYISPEDAAKKDAQIRRYENDSVKTRIALEMGLPYELAGRLNGDDEESIRRDAEEMQKLLGSQKKTPPLGSTEPIGDNSKDAAMLNMLRQLKGD